MKIGVHVNGFSLKQKGCLFFVQFSLMTHY